MKCNLASDIKGGMVDWSLNEHGSEYIGTKSETAVGFVVLILKVSF
jgi:hypothetical protein